jgi:sugar phosphate isomerase/epimerase
VAQAGFDGVELVHNHGIPAGEMKAILAENGLIPASAHVGYETLREDLAGVIEFHQAVGNSHLIVPAPPQGLRSATDPEPWRSFARSLADMGEICQGEGMRLGYHNHHWEMGVVMGRRVIDWLMAETDPKELFFEPDLAWVIHGGEDAAQLLAQYGERCLRIHMKDLAPKGQNEDEMGLADVGSGTLDWATLLPAAVGTGCPWLVVEHDKPKDPVASVTNSLNFIRANL